MGFNRSALLAGIILTYLGASGEEALDMIRNRREGALYNETFASYLCALPPYPEG
jgi:protein-tyrosine phosphatase